MYSDSLRLKDAVSITSEFGLESVTKKRSSSRNGGDQRHYHSKTGEPYKKRGNLTFKSQATDVLGDSDITKKFMNLYGQKRLNSMFLTFLRPSSASRVISFTEFTSQ